MQQVFRSIVGMGIYLSQERLDLSFVIKELASKMSSPTEGALQNMRRMIGYLKETEGQHILLAMGEGSEGIQMRGQKQWLLETFTDADWSGCKSTRRSTSGAIHAVNSMIVHASSRSQKTVSLSSAESELNALVAGACDGICIRYALEFLTGQEIQHVCWIDNSATRQIACKRGSGRLRHINGRLLWCQDKVAEGTLEVKQISTTLNLADIGTKLLGRNRLQLLLFWCNARDGNGGRVGEKEHETYATQRIEKGKVMKIANYLNRLILVGGLELAAGSRPTTELEKHSHSENAEGWLMFLCIGLLLGLMVWLFGKVKTLTTKIEVLESRLREEKARESDWADWHNRQTSMAVDYIERVHEGLIKNGGFVDLSSIEPDDRKFMEFLEHRNRVKAGVLLSEQWKTVDMRQAEREGRPFINRSYRSASEAAAAAAGRPPPRTPPVSAEEARSSGGAEGEERVLSGNTVTVRLDSGETVENPEEYVEVRPSSNQGEEEVAEQEHLPDAAAGGSEEAAADDDVEMDGSKTESWHPPPVEIPVVKFNHWNTLRSRAALRARQDLMVLEVSWFHYTREGDSRQAGRLYELMGEMYEYMDLRPEGVNES